MTPAGELQFSERSSVKEGLVEELRETTASVTPRLARVERVGRDGGRLGVHLAGGEVLRAHRVVVGIGRSGNFRKLGVPGEDKDKVSNRLHDPKDYCGQNVLVVGGGDSALEAAIALGWAALTAFVAFCTWLYHWKGGKAIPLLGSSPPG